MADQSLLDAQAHIYAEQHGVSYAEAVSEVGARIGGASVTPDYTSQPSSNGGQGNRVDSARLQLEAAAGLLCGIEFARDHQTRLDLLVAAHTQCQAASLFIANHYEEVRGHA